MPNILQLHESLQPGFWQLWPLCCRQPLPALQLGDIVSLRRRLLHTEQFSLPLSDPRISTPPDDGAGEAKYLGRAPVDPPDVEVLHRELGDRGPAGAYERHHPRRESVGVL